ncbi:hypothetical protein FQR65_LT20538 [Abscondita terminalis]|nr:hypothetical protein FQR65_LT20538 [Abscondita terminalis]
MTVPPPQQPCEPGCGRILPATRQHGNPVQGLTIDASEKTWVSHGNAVYSRIGSAANWSHYTMANEQSSVRTTAPPLPPTCRGISAGLNAGSPIRRSPRKKATQATASGTTRRHGLPINGVDGPRQSPPTAKNGSAPKASVSYSNVPPTTYNTGNSAAA